ncbi:MAG: hypothetical protein GY926_14935 [bacterium]|nr:hypothetical protein [bacterium]
MKRKRLDEDSRWTSHIVFASGELKIVQAFVNTAVLRTRTEEPAGPRPLAGALAAGARGRRAERSSCWADLPHRPARALGLRRQSGEVGRGPRPGLLRALSADRAGPQPALPLPPLKEGIKEIQC